MHKDFIYIPSCSVYININHIVELTIYSEFFVVTVDSVNSDGYSTSYTFAMSDLKYFEKITGAHAIISGGKMSIKEDEQFRYLIDRYKKACESYGINFNYYTRMEVDGETIDDLLKKLESTQTQLIDYIDEYVSKREEEKCPLIKERIND